MSRLKQLIQEVHRRSLWQVLAIYVVVSWVIRGYWRGHSDGLPGPATQTGNWD